jgi:hypothetical protein
LVVGPPLAGIFVALLEGAGEAGFEVVLLGVGVAGEVLVEPPPPPSGAQGPTVAVAEALAEADAEAEPVESVG